MCVGVGGGGGGSTYIRTGSPRGGSRRGRSPRCPSPPPPVASRHSLVVGWWRAAAGRSRRKHLGVSVCVPRWSPSGGWRRRGGGRSGGDGGRGEGDGVSDVRGRTTDGIGTPPPTLRRFRASSWGGGGGVFVSVGYGFRGRDAWGPGGVGTISQREGAGCKCQDVLLHSVVGSTCVW